MSNVLDILTERGFIEKTTHDEELREYLNESGRSCYIGFDPTASSLHVGSLVPIMSLAHMQRNGHRPIALVGGGTGLVGDPSGKTEMRKMLTLEEIDGNAEGIKQQLSRFIDFGDDKAMMVNNADWLVPIKYIPFLRDVGRHFSVNRMIKAESYKNRLDSEEGLSFLEFNYMVLQAYDFHVLAERHDCVIQMGGSDQWGNIVAGIDLIRRLGQKSAFGITFPLITTSGGAKMGKTAKGAVWLDAERTSPYEYYQYWVNTDDRDVYRFLLLFTFLPKEEILPVKELDGAELNDAKAVLAFEAVRIAHGLDEAWKAYRDAAAMFGSRQIPISLMPSSEIHKRMERVEDEGIPSVDISPEVLEKGIPAYQLFSDAGLCDSKGAARRLIQQGGAYVNGDRVEEYDLLISDNHLNNGEIILRAGKKRYIKVRVENLS